MKRRLAALSIAIALFFAVQPASPQTADVIREVHDGFGRTGSFLGAEPPLPSERLIASLGAADYRDRETAMRQLMSLGVKVLPELKAALGKTSNPEITQRLEALIDAIGVKRLMDPTLITMSLQGATPRELFLELSRASGCRFPSPKETVAKGRFSIDVKDKPLWEVLRTINVQTGIEVIADGHGFCVNHGDDSVAPFVHIAGPFRFTAEGIILRGESLLKRTRTGPLLGWDTGYYLNIRLDVEPKIALLGLSSLNFTRAVDNLGNSLLSSTEAREGYDYAQQLRRGDHPLKQYEQFNIDLARKDRVATEIADVQGTAKIVLVRDVKCDILVATLPKDRRTYKGHLFTLTVETVKLSEADDELNVVFELVPNRKDAYEMLGGRGIFDRVVLETASGRRGVLDFNPILPPKAPEVAQPGLIPPPGNTDDEIAISRWAMRMRAPEGTKASDFTRLKVLDWVTMEREVPFAFKNIPLP